MTIRAQKPARDSGRGLAFLERAAVHTGARLYVAHAQARLEHGDSEFGDRWATIGLRTFVHELSEEGADLGAWSALADQAVDLEQLNDPRRVRLYLTLAARGGAIAHQAVEQLARLLDVEIPGAAAA